MCDDLGESRLRALQQTADDALQATEGGVVDGFEERFPVPSIGGITFIPVGTYRSDGSLTTDEATEVKQRLDAVSPKPLPLWMQFDDVRSEFVEVLALLDTQVQCLCHVPLPPLSRETQRA